MHRSTRFLFYAIAISLLTATVAGCQSVDSSRIEDLEARLDAQEAELRRQESQIQLLGTATVISPASVFDDPLTQFFEAAEFWEAIWTDGGVCRSDCNAEARQVCRAGNEDSDECEAARLRASACMQECPI